MDTLLRSQYIDLHLPVVSAKTELALQNVTAVLFLAALSGYDQGLIEDRDSVSVQTASL
jgi:hypothetical protein